MAYNVERDWTTGAGLRAVVAMMEIGHRCGYVGVPVGHPLHGVGYDSDTPALAPIDLETAEIGKRSLLGVLCAKDKLRSPEMAFDVHGGLTYAGNGEGKYPVESDLWWFGYDCGHAGDAPAPGSTMYRYGYRDSSEVHRSLNYCERECESLAKQIVAATHHTARDD